MAMMKCIGVVGCGTMGAGIANVILQNGYQVIVRETDPSFLEKGFARIQDLFNKLERKGKISLSEREQFLKQLTGTTQAEDLAICDMVIEAVFEDLVIKKSLFTSLDAVCPEETIFATNTSSLCVTEIAGAINRMDRFVGLHFFNPATMMPLVEVVRTIATSSETVQSVLTFVDSIGKTAIQAKDNAGFIVNRFMTPFILDAMRGVEQGIASVQDIDLGMKLGCNHPMGPLMLADFIGLDLLYTGANRMFEEYRDSRYAPPPLLKRLVLLNNLGKKTGKGFYDWSDPSHPVPQDLAV
jgi:3-hydroxybutyryl-CoA dehydrogenase